MSVTINTTITIHLNGNVITSTESVHFFDLRALDMIKKQMSLALRKNPNASLDVCHEVLNDIIRNINQG